MRDYELAFIIKPTIDDESVNGVIDGVKGLIGAVNGEVASVDLWGRRTLAYPIHNFYEGIYVLVQAKMPSSGPLELERDLKLSEEIIRYMLVKVEQ
jgi:small subunit ribosomal protein S6